MMSQPSISNFHLGLTGYPLSHSLSPRIHTAALDACGLEGQYSVYPIAPDDKQGFKDLLARVRTGEIHGLNVTIPHKQNVIEFLDELSPAARAIGAVNTIFRRKGKLIGENTDAPGFLLDLNRFLTTETRRQRGKKSLVLGAGGSARAVVYALLKDSWQVMIAARRIEQAQLLVHSYTDYPLQVAALDDLRPSTFDLIVNTTPVGMAPHIDRSPWPQNFPFPPRAAIYDLVYNPGETMLVANARAQGLPAVTGLGMLVEQAALSFKIWTGCDVSRESLFTAINSSLLSTL